MPAPSNPFPGMNPFLQESWNDVHTMLIGYIRDALSEVLPADLVARAEEQVALEEDGERARFRRADVALIEPWSAGSTFPPSCPEGGAPAVAEPLVFHEELVNERWVEVQNAHGLLITVIEVLSPWNKTKEGATDYRARQRRFLAAGVNLVEIDLIRGGRHVLAIRRDRFELPPGTCHLVCATRMTGAEHLRQEVYRCPLRAPLPAVRVPLRRNEADVTLALQPLVDRCYRTGRYWLTERAAPKLQPPAADAGEAAWIEERRQAGHAGV